MKVLMGRENAYTVVVSATQNSNLSTQANSPLLQKSIRGSKVDQRPPADTTLPKERKW